VAEANLVKDGSFGAVATDTMDSVVAINAVDRNVLGPNPHDGAMDLVESLQIMTAGTDQSGIEKGNICEACVPWARKRRD
jgi:hypothetical protein